MVVDTLVLGDFQTNCFVVRADARAKECVVIDPGLDAEPLLDFLEAKGLRPAVVLLTHGHADHIEGVNLLRQRYPGVPVAIHEADAGMLADPMSNVSGMLGMPIEVGPAEVVLRDGERVEYAGVAFEVLHTPGHTAGGAAFYAADAKAVFAGDTLFAGSIGRTDFPGGNYAKLIASVRGRLFALPDETVVYSGHGPETTVGAEKRYNPFFQ